MLDMITKKPLQVQPGGNPAGQYASGPRLRVPLDQLAEIRAVLERHKFQHWTNEFAISIDNGPSYIAIVFSRYEKLEPIQAALDAIP